MKRFNSSFSINGRLVGKSASVYIIAEGGLAHFGNLQKAISLIDLAVDSGADAFKTQAFKTESLVSPRDTEWYRRLKTREVSFDFISAMKDYCDYRGITFLCTPHDSSVLPWLRELDVPACKIGSGERGNIQFLRKMAKIGKPLVLSTGMYNETDLIETLDVLAHDGVLDVALMHCVTSYPTPIDQVNLQAINRMKELFNGPVGYSDHTEGHHIILAAVALGASIVEKHITLDYNVKDAQDWKVSCGPDDFPELVAEIRDVEKALGKPIKKTQSCENKAVIWATKSLVAAKDLPVGTLLTNDHLIAKRPGDGIKPNQINQLIGKRLTKLVKANELVLLENLTEP